MKNKTPVSVFIIAKNEEDRIHYSINSVKNWADEIIVIDSGSDDKTVEISKKLGATVLFNEWKGYGQQKIFGESICKNDWILNIDADEEISPELKNEIEIALKDNDKKAFHIPIKTMSLNSQKPPRFAPSNEPIRLYNKKFAGFKDSIVHDSVVVNNNTKVGELKNIVYHRSFRSYKHAIEKINYYSTLQAEDMFAKGKKPSLLKIITEPFWAFFKAYFLRKYIFFGVDGFIEGIIYAFSRTIRLAKTRELYKNKPNNLIS